MAIKLAKANDMLLKLRYVLDGNALRSVYFTIFESYDMPLLFGHKTIIQLKCFIYYRKNPSG